MTALTARAAGVSTVWVASPRPAVATLAAAFVAKVDGLMAIGGAQAVAAMAYGTGPLPACDVIVGPGNKWVTAAKSLVAGICAIDMLAGPSEVLVIADHSCDTDTVAADLLAQAEHDTEARPILVCTDRAIADRVNQKIGERLSTLSTADTAREAVKKGFACVCEDLETAVRVSNIIGPEHLEVHTEQAERVSKLCTNYGAVFIGQVSAEVLGDYGMGPNHVLPTCGTSRYTG
jgi:phosphoribosyl-ATP pyrophosphohydrolase/phosphoribosyl-AMP cyclohydrolase/histidinol dehydrogenase